MQGSVTGEAIAQVNGLGLQAVVALVEHLLGMREAMTIRIAVPHDALQAFCQKWHVTELAFFGSVLRDDFGPRSDIDVLVSFAPGQAPGFDFVTMHDELALILGRPVDIVERRGVEHSLMARAILDTAEVYYAA
jgi:predicted nucleotidyltransferase